MKAAEITLTCAEVGAAARLAPAAPRVLHIDADERAARVLAALLAPEAQVVHVPTLAAARSLLAREAFALVVIDPNLPDSEAALALALPVPPATPVLVHSARVPSWHAPSMPFLPKPWTPQRELWNTISHLLGIAPRAPVSTRGEHE